MFYFRWVHESGLLDYRKCGPREGMSEAVAHVTRLTYAVLDVMGGQAYYSAKKDEDGRDSLKVDEPDHD